MVSALGSRIGWTPAHKERTNDLNQAGVTPEESPLYENGVYVSGSKERDTVVKIVDSHSCSDQMHNWMHCQVRQLAAQMFMSSSEVGCTRSTPTPVLRHTTAFVSTRMKVVEVLRAL